LQVFVGIADGLDEETFVGIAGDEAGAGGAAFEEAVTGVEGEAAFGFALGGVVARVAGIDEDRADFGFEEFDLIGRERGGCRGGAGGGREEGEEWEDGEEGEGAEGGTQREEVAERARFLAAKRRKKSEGDGGSKGV
jgi:hypothetical protein